MFNINDFDMPSSVRINDFDNFPPPTGEVALNDFDNYFDQDPKDEGHHDDDFDGFMEEHLFTAGEELDEDIDLLKGLAEQIMDDIISDDTLLLEFPRERVYAYEIMFRQPHNVHREYSDEHDSSSEPTPIYDELREKFAREMKRKGM